MPFFIPSPNWCIWNSSISYCLKFPPMFWKLLPFCWTLSETRVTRMETLYTKMRYLTRYTYGQLKETRRKLNSMCSIIIPFELIACSKVAGSFYIHSCYGSASITTVHASSLKTAAVVQIIIFQMFTDISATTFIHYHAVEL